MEVIDFSKEKFQRLQIEPRLQSKNRASKSVSGSAKGRNLNMEDRVIIIA